MYRILFVLIHFAAIIIAGCQSAHLHAWPSPHLSDDEKTSLSQIPVVLLRCDDRTGCNAVAIAPGVFVTASHAVYSPARVESLNYLPVSTIVHYVNISRSDAERLGWEDGIAVIRVDPRDPAAAELADLASLNIADTPLVAGDECFVVCDLNASPGNNFADAIQEITPASLTVAYRVRVIQPPRRLLERGHPGVQLCTFTRLPVEEMQGFSGAAIVRQKSDNVFELVAIVLGTHRGEVVAATVSPTFATTYASPTP